MNDAECIATIVGIRFHYMMISATPQVLDNIDALLCRFQELCGVVSPQASPASSEPKPEAPSEEPKHC